MLVDKGDVANVSPCTSGGVGGSVPATLSLTLGAHASFGAFTPGIAKDYTASTTATVISTAGDAALTVADPEPRTGHLVNGTFSLPSAAAQVTFSKSACDRSRLSNDPVDDQLQAAHQRHRRAAHGQPTARR